MTTLPDWLDPATLKWCSEKLRERVPTDRTDLGAREAQFWGREFRRAATRIELRTLATRIENRRKRGEG